MQNGIDEPNGMTLENLSSADAQRIVQVGEEASRLLNSPVYNMAYTELMNKSYQDWLNSSPKEERRRESLYHEAKGLERVTELMQSSIVNAQQVLEQQARDNDPGVKQQRYMDNQGFGSN